MLQKRNNRLLHPHIAYPTSWHSLLLGVGSSIVVFLFLYIFEPFQIYTITEPSFKLRLILGYTLVWPFCVFFMIEVLGRVFANYRRYYSRPAQVVVEEILTPPASSEMVPKISVDEAILTLVAENGKDKLTILPQQLCYIEADDNYVTVVFQENQKIRKELLRNSLGRIESQITASYIRRCHRSYMVNLHKVYRVSGNAQGYKLHLWQVTEPLPVSRGYAKQVILNA
jgi:LytTr DNA-binding domain